VTDADDRPEWLRAHEAFLAAGREITAYHIACIKAEERFRLVRPDEQDGFEERVARSILDGKR